MYLKYQARTDHLEIQSSCVECTTKPTALAWVVHQLQRSQIKGTDFVACNLKLFH